ncbi:MAG: PKD domain-containing protein [Pedobacter sp.]|nr:MAG: PKD domain-containing protein [Pedobacter sp.]
MKKHNLTNFTKSLRQNWLQKCFLMLAMFVLSNAAANAQCAASFTYAQTGNKVSFTNTSTSNTSYIWRTTWDFGDATGKNYNKNPTHTYSSAGTYIVKLIMMGDSLGKCIDSTWDSVLVTANCDARYSYNVNGYNLNMGASSSFAGKKYKWFIRTTSENYITSFNGTSASYTFSTPGKYNVVLMVSDSSIKCVDSVKKTITIAAPTCKPSFSYNILGAVVDFYVAPQPGKTFIWSFGDKSSSTTKDTAIYHRYSKAGNYWTCLTAIDSLSGCKDSTCSLIKISDTTCNANFTYYISGKEVIIFTPQNKSSAVYKWILYSNDSGNNYVDSSDLSHVFSHSFPKAGKYTICLTINDGFCSKSYCADSITIYDCKADFNFSKTSLQASFTNNSKKGNTTQFFWNFGDNTTSTSTNPTHTYTYSGNYNVTLVMKDSTRGCNDTIKKQISLTDTATCNANFTVYSSGREIYITPPTNSPGTKYSWSFGDGTTSNKGDTVLINHSYASDSTYTICLTVSHNNCSDTFCREIVVSKPSKFSISGNLYLGTGSNSADKAVVYLISYNPADSMLTAVDSINVSSDTSICPYRFENKKNGTYYVKAGLLSTSSYYADYFPTYHDSLLEWINALPIVVNGSNEVVDIYLVQGTNPGGSAFIGGKVLQGSLKKEGDPLENIQVMLFNANKRPVAYTYSDKDGNFSFKNLAFGKYEIYTEVPGVKTVAGFVTLSESHPKEENVTVRVSASGISTSIRQPLSQEFASQPKLYPNPVLHNLYLETNMKKSQQAEIVIYNVTGQQVYSENISLQQGSQTHFISADKLPEGIYMLMLKNASGAGELHYKVVKAN